MSMLFTPSPPPIESINDDIETIQVKRQERYTPDMASSVPRVLQLDTVIPHDPLIGALSSPSSTSTDSDMSTVYSNELRDSIRICLSRKTRFMGIPYILSSSFYVPPENGSDYSPTCRSPRNSFSLKKFIPKMINRALCAITSFFGKFQRGNEVKKNPYEDEGFVKSFI
mmetsp:Transcript_2613/g.3938  ORF Transcript_2613/g.3938 Transcript_2613/m.3938 type:complete len:169 (+) Transcript_2613:78-584(+)